MQAASMLFLPSALLADGLPSCTLHVPSAGKSAAVKADKLVLTDPGATNISISVQALLANDRGCNGAANMSALLPGGGLRVRLERRPSKGSVVLSTSGTLTYLLGSAWQKRTSTSDVFSYRLFDTCGWSRSTATVTVNWDASLPRAADDVFAANASAPASRLDVLRNDGGSELFVANVSKASGGTVAVSSDGQALEFTPPSTAGMVSACAGVHSTLLLATPFGIRDKPACC